MKIPVVLLDRLFLRMLRVAQSRSPDVLIGKDDDIYLRRWWVIPRNRILNVYLHNFLRSDDDRALHDHPWWNMSLLLSGSYTEHTIAAGGINRRVRYTQGEIKFRGARTAHRVELPMVADGQGHRETPCWTVFITGPNIRSWGFHCPQGWRHWKDFTAPENSGQIGRGCD
jgi:hypothetical protein